MVGVEVGAVASEQLLTGYPADCGYAGLYGDFHIAVPSVSYKNALPQSSTHNVIGPYVGDVDVSLIALQISTLLSL